MSDILRMRIPDTNMELVAEYSSWSGETVIVCITTSGAYRIGKVSRETVTHPRQPTDYEDFRDLLIEGTGYNSWPDLDDPFWPSFFDSVRDAHMAAEVVFD